MRLSVLWIIVSHSLPLLSVFDDWHPFRCSALIPLGLVRCQRHVRMSSFLLDETRLSLIHWVLSFLRLYMLATLGWLIINLHVLLILSAKRPIQRFPKPKHARKSHSHSIILKFGLAPYFKLRRSTVTMFSSICSRRPFSVAKEFFQRLNPFSLLFFTFYGKSWTCLISRAI